MGSIVIIFVSIKTQVFCLKMNKNCLNSEFCEEDKNRKNKIKYLLCEQVALFKDKTDKI